MPVWEAKRRIPSGEFMLWKVHFRERLNEPNPLYSYLAQIAQTNIQAFSQKPNDIPLDDFILKFEEKKAKDLDRPVELSESEKKGRLKTIKGAVMGMFGMNPKEIPDKVKDKMEG